MINAKEGIVGGGVGRIVLRLSGELGKSTKIGLEGKIIRKDGGKKAD
jgi:hypothetical protein